VLRNLQLNVQHRPSGRHRLLSILPVDQGIDTPGGQLRSQPRYFDPKNLVELPSPATATPWPPLVSWGGSPPLRHKIPFIAKLNHNELLTYRPSTTDPVRSVPQAYELARWGSGDYLLRVGGVRPPDTGDLEAFKKRTRWACSPCCGPTCATTLQGRRRRLLLAPISRAGNHNRRDIEADIIKQKQAETTTATAPSTSGADKLVYEQLTTDNTIDLTVGRWSTASRTHPDDQLGGDSKGDTDLARPYAPVINKRAGGRPHHRSQSRR